MEALWHKVAENGFLVFVEQGTPKGFRMIHDLRKFLISRGNSDFVAPCPHMFQCPLANGENWCNFGQGYNIFPKGIVGKLSHQRSNGIEKFSYLIARKTKQTKDIENCNTLLEKSMFWDR